mgnify:CR=1 FL=1
MLTGEEPGDPLDDLRAAVDAVSSKLGERLRFLVGKPGLDGHSNGAEQIAVRARDAGLEVIYEGIRSTPEQIVAIGEAEELCFGELQTPHHLIIVPISEQVDVFLDQLSETARANVCWHTAERVYGGNKWKVMEE